MFSNRAPYLFIVDDEVMQMNAMCSTLQDSGYECLGLTSAQAALAALRQRPCDVLLTDLKMPDMDGIELLRAAREIDRELVGIVMTGEGTITSAVEAMQSGALDYILKPFRLSTILPVIKRALSVRQLQLENAALERKVAERTAELLEANQELQAFVYSVSHDLRNPLNSVVGFSDILIDGAQPPLEGKWLEYVKEIRGSGIHMNELIDDLLRLSQISLQEMKNQAVDLSALANKVIEDRRAISPDRSVRVEIESELIANGDTGLLRIALDNLIGNAWKYTGKCDAAHIQFRRFTNKAGIQGYEVRDNGAGFNIGEAQRLFEPFYRMHSEADFVGTGIGLSIVRRVIQRHGGRIWAESAVGKGSSFYFTLSEPSVS